MEENAVGHQQERSNNQPRPAADQSVSRDVDPATDSLSSLHADMGFLGSIPAVSRVRIVQQVCTIGQLYYLGWQPCLLGYS